VEKNHIQNTDVNKSKNISEVFQKILETFCVNKISFWK